MPNTITYLGHPQLIFQTDLIIKQIFYKLAISYEFVQFHLYKNKLFSGKKYAWRSTPRPKPKPNFHGSTSRLYKVIWMNMNMFLDSFYSVILIKHSINRKSLPFDIFLPSYTVRPGPKDTFCIKCIILEIRFCYIDLICNISNCITVSPNPYQMWTQTLSVLLHNKQRKCCSCGSEEAS